MQLRWCGSLNFPEIFASASSSFYVSRLPVDTDSALSVVECRFPYSTDSSTKVRSDAQWHPRLVGHFQRRCWSWLHWRQSAGLHTKLPPPLAGYPGSSRDEYRDQIAGQDLFFLHVVQYIKNICFRIPEILISIGLHSGFVILDIELLAELVIIITLR